MKNIFALTIVGLIISISTFAQSNKEEIEFFQSIFGAEKKAIVANFIGDADEAFWTKYDLYETERKALGQSRIALLKEYAENYSSLTDAKTDELMVKLVKQKSSTDKLITKYYKQIRKTSGSKAAAQFMQIETYFLSGIRMAILENIPFIGELDN